MKIYWKPFLQTLIFILFYVILANSRSIEPNPFIPGAVVAVYMVVPVVAGILFGPRSGFLVGLFGTTLNTLTPGGSVFELLSIIPNSLMGLSAGLLKRWFPSPIAASSLVIGHLLRLLSFLIAGLMPLGVLDNLNFWYGTAYEAFFGIIAVLIIIAIYRLAIPSEENETDN